MEKDVGVGVTFQTVRVRNFNTAEDQFPPWFEAVNIVADSRPEHVVRLR